MAYIVNGQRVNQAPAPTRKQGAPEFLEAINQFNPQQQQALQQMLQQGLGNLGSLNLPSNQQQQNNFQPIADNARRQFSQNTIPGIAERFSSMGSGSSLSSPDLYRQLGGAGADLESQLAALGAQYGLQQQGLNLQEQGLQSNNLFNLLNSGLNPQEEYIRHPEQQRNGSGFGNFFRNNLGTLLTLGGTLAGGPVGGAIGSQLGQGLSSSRGFSNPNQF